MKRMSGLALAKWVATLATLGAVGGVGGVVLEASAQVATPPPARRGAQDEDPKAAPLFREAGDVAAKIEAGKATAAAERRRILIIWGSATDPLCDRLLVALEALDTQKLRRAEYVEVWAEVSAGDRADANSALAKGLGVEVGPGKPAALTVLDEKGGVIASVATPELYDPERSRARPVYSVPRVFNFLKEHQTTRLVAADVVRAGVEAAGRDAKGVLVYFTQAGERWAMRFDTLMRREPVKRVLSAHFVVIPIDLVRVDKAWEQMETYVPSPENLPVFAALKPDGAAAGTSQDGNEGNIGYPTSDAEFARMMGVLKAGWSAWPKAAGGGQGPDWGAIEKVLREEAEAVVKLGDQALTR